MTWILADERTVTRSNSLDRTDIAAWVDWFYLTYLPTRGYTATKGTSGIDDYYYGTRQNWVTTIGTDMQTSQVHEFEFSQLDVSCNSWDIAESDPTLGLQNKSGSATSPILYSYGTFDLQVWQSDQDSNSFLVRRKGVATGAADGGNLLAFSLPFSGATNDTLDDPYYWEAWFASGNLTTGVRYVVGTGRYNNKTGFITNAVDFCGTNQSYPTSYKTHEYVSTDMFTKYNRASNGSIDSTALYNDETSCEAVQISDDFYIDLNASVSISILLKTGSVNPDDVSL
jgi:hypothetical protein